MRCKVSAKVRPLAVTSACTEVSLAGAEQVAQRQVIGADDGHVVGNREASVLQDAHQQHGELVVVGEDRAGCWHAGDGRRSAPRPVRRNRDRCARGRDRASAPRAPPQISARGRARSGLARAGRSRQHGGGRGRRGSRRRTRPRAWSSTSVGTSSLGRQPQPRMARMPARCSRSTAGGEVERSGR